MDRDGAECYDSDMSLWLCSRVRRWFEVAAETAMKVTRVACIVSVALAIALCVGATLVAQSDDPRKPEPYINKYVSMMLLSTMPGAPYSLERENRAPGIKNGVPVENIERYKQFRDSRGWVREEYYRAQRASDEPVEKLAMVLIADPAEHKRYWMVDAGGNPSWLLLGARPELVNDVHGWPAGVAGAPANAAMGEGEKRIEYMTVSLGEDTMLGVSVVGIRQTATRANGEKMYEIEGWFSPELQLPMLVKSDDQHGHVERRVTKIDRTEPDAALFVPPADYKVAQK